MKVVVVIKVLVTALSLIVSHNLQELCRYIRVLSLIEDPFHIGLLKDVLDINLCILLRLISRAYLANKVWTLVAELVLLSSSLLFFVSQQ